MIEALTYFLALVSHLYTSLPRPPAAKPLPPMELREERIHLVTLAFDGASSVRPIGAIDGETKTLLVDAREFAALLPGSEVSESSLRWLRPDGEFSGRRAVVANKEIRRRCFRVSAAGKKSAVPVAECDWYRDAAAVRGRAIETVSFGEVERIIAHQQAPCDPRGGSAITRRTATFLTAGHVMSDELRRWSGNAEVAGRLTIEVPEEVARDPRLDWDKARAESAKPTAGPLAEFMGGEARVWSEEDDMYATCLGKNGDRHAYLDYE